MTPLDPKGVPLKEVLEGAISYMKQTEVAARRGVDGYPIDLQRCLEYQLKELDK